MRHILVLLAAMMLAPLQALRAEPPTRLPEKADFHLYLLVGQSNMAGRGQLEDQDRTPHPRVLTLNKNDEWVPAVDPLHFDKSAAGVGLGKTFGQLVAEASPGVTIGLIPCAVGGSPIDTWRPGKVHSQTRSRPWDDTLRRARLALQAGELKGILWHQGESDSKAGLAEGYEAKLDDLIARFRKELGAPDVPFVAGQMGRFEERPWDEFRKLVDNAHRGLPDRVPHTAFVSAEGLSHKGDMIHFDSASYRELGKRFAAAFLKLTNQPQGAHSK